MEGWAAVSHSFSLVKRTHMTDFVTLIGIDYSSIAYTANNGFASVGTNNGHNGTSGIQFLNNTEVVIDFAWRA